MEHQQDTKLRSKTGHKHQTSTQETGQPIGTQGGQTTNVVASGKVKSTKDIRPEVTQKSAIVKETETSTQETGQLIRTQGGQTTNVVASGKIKSTKDIRKETEKGVTQFFGGLTKTLISGLLGAAFLPIFGPVVATVAATTAFMVTSIQDNLESLGVHLQEDTIHSLVEPLKGKKIDESDLRKVIEEVLSKNRQANEDLAKAFIDLIPTIQKAAGSTNIEISGPVQSLIAGDHNAITQTFGDFLKDNVKRTSR